MTNPTSTFLVATLVLSSGFCFSEAFITTRTFLKGRSPTSAPGLYYAPKGSLDAGSNNKRRRGRPRSNKTTTAAAASNKKKPAARRRPRSATVAAAAAAVTDPGPTQRKQQRASSNPVKNITSKKKTSRKRSPSAAGQALLQSLLDHDLLTKEEELHLGSQVRRASQIQDTLAAWTEENSSRIQQQQEYQRLENIQEEEDNNPLYGSANSQAMEHYLANGGEPQEYLFYDDGTPFSEEGEDVYGGMMNDYTVFQPQPQQLQPSVPESWMDDILLQQEDHGTVLATSILTDDDIRRVLELQGGRSELRTVLLEGALARDKLIRSNVKLVYNIAKKWVGDAPKSSQGNSLVRVYNGAAASITGRPTLDEALQEGILGLAEAAQRFDPDRGFRFSTYATVWVTNSVRKCFQLESTSGIRLPVPYYDMKRKYVTRVRHYLNTQGEVPSMEVLADDLGVSVKRLVAALQLTQPLQSLDSPMASSGSAGAGKAGSVSAADDGYTLASLLASDEPLPEDHVERSLLRQCLENAMATELSPNERDVVRLRLGLDDGVPQTAKEVADVFGGRFSEPAIRAMEQRAFNKLRSPFGVHTQQLMAYLDFAGIDGRNQLLR